MKKLKEYFVHKSLYGYKAVELRVKLKKEHEQVWLYFGNALWMAALGGYMFYAGYQHTALIMYILTAIMVVAALFQYMFVQMMDQAIFLLENTETKEERYA